MTVGAREPGGARAVGRREPLRIAVLASGRGSNLQAIIDAIEAGRVNACLPVVVSDRADAQALERAVKHGAEAAWVDPRDYADREAFDRAVPDPGTRRR